MSGRSVASAIWRSASRTRTRSSKPRATSSTTSATVRRICFGRVAMGGGGGGAGFSNVDDIFSAFGDIFGGNAFLPVLFLVASLLSGQAVVPQAQVTDIYLTGLGALLSVVYMFGIVFRPSRTVARIGLDSAVVLLLYLLGIAGLVAIATS